MNHKTIHLKKIDSTNDYALRNMAKLEAEITIYADEQTAGKGRNNRTWISSQKSNLYFTIILKPDLKKFTVLPNITQYMAIVICRILEKYEIIAQIKWPNDILVDGKKIAGILCETVFKGSNLEGIALGVGVNLNMSEDFLAIIDQPATALNVLLGKRINRRKFLDILLDEFFENYESFLLQGFVCIRDEYKQKLISLNKSVKINMLDEISEGIIRNIDLIGQLILEQKNKQKIIVNVGDVIL